MLEPIWGLKTISIFDVWTFEHILTGISVGTGVIISNRKSLGEIFNSVKDKIFHPHKLNLILYKYDIIFLLFIAYIWETLEHYIETGLMGQWLMQWFAGVEFWPNRLISDPLMLVLGYFLAKKFPVLVWPARVLSLLWIVVHLWIFQDSMYLHKIF